MRFVLLHYRFIAFFPFDYSFIDAVFLLIHFHIRRLWPQQEFPSSETGLTYAISRTGFDSCRRRCHQPSSLQQQQQQQQPAGSTMQQHNKLQQQSALATMKSPMQQQFQRHSQRK